MKIAIPILIIVFMIAVPVYSLKSNYAIFHTYLVGSDCESVIKRKSDIGYSSSVNYYVYTERNGSEIEIRVPYSVNNNKETGDSIKYKYVDGSNFGVYAGSLHPFNFSIF